MCHWYTEMNHHSKSRSQDWRVMCLVSTWQESQTLHIQTVNPKHCADISRWNLLFFQDKLPSLCQMVPWEINVVTAFSRLFRLHQAAGVGLAQKLAFNRGWILLKDDFEWCPLGMFLIFTISPIIRPHSPFTFHILACLMWAFQRRKQSFLSSHQTHYKPRCYTSSFIVGFYTAAKSKILSPFWCC